MTNEELKACREAFESALKEIAGMTLDKDIMAVHLKPDTLFRLWQAAYQSRPQDGDNPIANNEGLVKDICAQLYLMRNRDNGNEVIIRLLLEKCKAALQAEPKEDI